MRVPSFRRARWPRGRVKSGAEGGRAAGPRFTGAEACRPRGAGWRRAESPAEECSHAPRQTCRGSERVAKRWRPRNARRASRARAGGGGGARPERGEPRAGQARRVAERPGLPPRCPARGRAPPQSPGPGAWTSPRAPAGSCGRGLRGGSGRRGPPRASGRPRLSRSPRAAAAAPGRPGKAEAKEPGQRSAGARDPPRGGRGPFAGGCKGPSARPGARGAGQEPSSLSPCVGRPEWGASAREVGGASFA